MTIGVAGARVAFQCNGVSTVFPVPIQAYSAADFLVMLTAPASQGGGSIPLVLNSAYSMASSGTQQPPQWTLTTLGAIPYATGYTLQVILTPVETQQTQYVQGQAFPSLAVQTNFDRLTQMIQRIQDQVSNRSLIAPDGDVSPAMALPAAALRAGMIQGYDANGNSSMLSVLPPATVLSAAIIGGFITSQTADESIAGVTPINLWIAPGNLVRYGADPTGVSDSSNAIRQAALVHAVAQREIVCDGTFLYTPTGRIDISGIWSGKGKKRTLFKLNTSLYGAASLYSGAPANTADYFRVNGHGVLRDMTIQATTGLLVGSGVYLANDPDSANTGDIRLSGLQVVGFNYNIAVGGVYDVVMDRCDGLNGNYGEWCVPNPALGGTATANAVTHLNCNFQSNAVNVYANPGVNAETWAYYGCAIEDATGAVTIGGLTINAYFNNIDTLKLDTTYCEGSAFTWAFYILSVSTLKIDVMKNEASGGILIANVNNKASLECVSSVGILSAAGATTPVALSLKSCSFPSSGNLFNAATTNIENTTINVVSPTVLNLIGAPAIIAAGTPITAGGALGVAFGSAASTPGVYFGSGVPTISAAQGSLYIRTDGSSGSTRMYVNTNGTTGWTNVTTAVMSDEDDLAKLAVEHGGWIATIVAGVGLWILKQILSSQFTRLLKEFEQLRHDVMDLKEDMAVVKAVLRERTSGGKYTSPGDRQ